MYVGITNADIRICRITNPPEQEVAPTPKVPLFPI